MLFRPAFLFLNSKAVMRSSCYGRSPVKLPAGIMHGDAWTYRENALEKENHIVNTEMASDEVTDSIAHIEMHRQEMAKETNLASACNEALRKLQELLRQEQEELQKNGPHAQHTANVAALTGAIDRVKSMAGVRNAGSPSKDRRPEGRRQTPAHGATPGPARNKGRRTMGRRER